MNLKTALSLIATISISLVAMISHSTPIGQLNAADLLQENGGDGSVGVVIRGRNIADSSGQATSAAGDFNGDGINDLIIGAPNADPNGRDSAGSIYIVFGSDGGFPAEFELANLHLSNGGEGTDGFVVNGVDASDRAGVAVDNAGDVNGDGIEDIIIGASQANSEGVVAAGQTYVLFGRQQGLPAELELSSLFPANDGDGSSGFVINGIEISDNSGGAVSGAGDFNGDGIADVIIGAANSDPGGRFSAGQSYLIFGRATGFPPTFELSSLLEVNGGDGSEGFVINGGEAFDHSGVAVSEAGDVNGDGFADVVIGADDAYSGGRRQAGASYILYGKSTGFPAEIELSSFTLDSAGNGLPGTVITGIDSFDHSGGAVSAAGDFNGDGYEDLLIGAQDADPQGRNGAGESYLIFGSDKLPSEISLSSIQESEDFIGFTIKGIIEQDQSGNAVKGAGDVNGDGLADIIIGAPAADPNEITSAGASYLIYGTKNFTQRSFELSSLLEPSTDDESPGIALNGIASNNRLGNSVTGIGDVNNDGIDEIVAGAPNAPSNLQVAAGESYLIFGRRSSNVFCQSPSLLIPDNNLSGTEDTIVVSSNETLAGLRVALRVTHPRIGDLSFSLEKEGAATVLIDRPGFIVTGAGCNYGNLSLILDDVAATDVQEQCLYRASAISGVHTPNEPLSIFDLLPFTGSWTLRATDSASSQVGIVDEWCLIPVPLDSDSDGFSDGTDNCVLIHNPEQIDSNGDGFGNACDPDIGGADGIGLDDCVVNFLDLTYLSDSFFSIPSSPNWNPDADFSGPSETPDNLINFFDLARFADNFLGPPGPNSGECTPIERREYVISINGPSVNPMNPLYDSSCDTGFGGYIDLSELNFSPDPNVVGQDVSFTAFEMQNIEFYGESRNGLSYTDNGFIYFNSIGVSPPWLPQNLPSEEPPNELIALAWSDWEIVYDPDFDQGVTTATGGLNTSIIEFTGLEPAPSGSTGNRIDAELIIRGLVNDLPGQYELVMAYDNVIGAFDDVVIGVENVNGTTGVQYTGPLTNGLIVCYDFVQPSNDLSEN